ncbi:MAG TPA: translation initiation factor IF-3 [Verrucomicrobiae bacterium]|nr:translation initiation factor IF-3 [Verrucomicrobiae bacterium]
MDGKKAIDSLAGATGKFEARYYNYVTTDEGALSRPFPSRNSSPASFYRINGKIRAREVRVIGIDGKQLGVMALNDALSLARQNGVDLVEIAATAVPPVCRVVDFGKFRYEQAKKDKESKKHQHASTVKEVQLSPRIDPHDLSVKVGHAIDFLCEDMKVKVTLRFRGREMQHTEFGFQVVQKLIAEVAPYGHPDFPPKLIGRGINLMLSPLPRNKRAKNPRQTDGGEDDNHSGEAKPKAKPPTSGDPAQQPMKINRPEGSESAGGFSNNPFSKL